MSAYLAFLAQLLVCGELFRGGRDKGRAQRGMPARTHAGLPWPLLWVRASVLLLFRRYFMCALPCTYLPARRSAVLRCA